MGDAENRLAGLVPSPEFDALRVGNYRVAS